MAYDLLATGALRSDFRTVGGNTMPSCGDLDPEAHQDIIELRKRTLSSLLCSQASFLRSLCPGNRTIFLIKRSVFQHLPTHLSCQLIICPSPWLNIRWVGIFLLLLPTIATIMPPAELTHRFSCRHTRRVFFLQNLE